MKSLIVYWFWPNPGGWHYADAHVRLILGICLLFVVGSFVIAYLRSRTSNPMTKILSKSWPSAAFWFGIVGAVLVVSREATIQFMSMRILWVVWGLLLGLYLFIQILSFRRRHYTVLQSQRVVDEREKYLPKRKK